MRYIDSGLRDASQALGTWLAEIVDNHIVEVRWQSGFFSADGIGIIAPALQRIAAEGRVIKAVIGSNDGVSLREDVDRLLVLLGIPRPNAHVGVVSYGGAYFHPKAYHFRREDGSQAAYVGSANLTAAGVTALHVEAGILLDTRDADDEGILSDIAMAVDDWFSGHRSGFTLVDGSTVLDQLVADGVLATAPPPRPARLSGVGRPGRLGRPHLRPLIVLPAPLGTRALPVPEPALPAMEQGPPGPGLAMNPVITKSGFPPYLRFDPDAVAPTSGVEALSGTALPTGATGLVVRLNRDSARHFTGSSGTANISIPVNTLTALRFGIFRGKYERPRAEYGLQIRYLGGDQTLRLYDMSTNVMAYGFAPGESGHGDVRMVVPALVRSLGEQANRAGLPVPANGDLALLEWPTLTLPQFRLSFLDRDTPLYEQVRALFDNAAAAGQLVGDGACWLPRGISPAW